PIRAAQLELLAFVEDVLLELFPVVVAPGDDLSHEGVEIVLGRRGAERQRGSENRRGEPGKGSGAHGLNLSGVERDGKLLKREDVTIARTWSADEEAVRRPVFHGRRRPPSPTEAVRHI